ncbi:MAG: hypothetical protein QNJ42_21280 [Crocosphaera sp.]|nr:hypothetical protein [Crocosphaera sp.]
MNKIKSKIVITFGVILFSSFTLLWSSFAYALSSLTPTEIGLNNIIDWALIPLSSSLFIIPVGLILLIIWKKRIIRLQTILEILSLKIPYSTHQSSSQSRSSRNNRSRSSSSSYSDYSSISSNQSFGGGDSGGGGAGGDF